MMRAGMRRNAPEPDEQEPMTRSWRAGRAQGACRRAGRARGAWELLAGPAV